MNKIKETFKGQVKISVEKIIIPTYPNEKPNPMPRYYEGAMHQGVQRRIYPYPMDDNNTFEKKDMEYNIIHVENEYLDLGFIPDLGGRIYFAKDKTNGYNYFYRNNVIKPSLIGMVGSWISGGLAWGFPHHHGPNTVEPMEYTIEEREDGSKTIWVSNTDRRHRMSILLGYTIYPDSSIIELTIKPLNKTAISNSFLFWTVPAVLCHEDYQVIFPPSVKYITFHWKRDMTTWPIADCQYNDFNFKGMDISLWKNTHVPSSFFAWNSRDGYFGGYDHKAQAGTVWVGNRFVSPGMKYWADGNNEFGEKINNGLTDNDGRYLELMSGLYSDNQPDYSWIQPYESKSGSMIYFPMRDLEGLKYANREGALNLVIEGKNIKLRINTTSSHKDAKVILRSKGEQLFEKIINISPAEPFKADVPLPANIVEDDLDITLICSDNNILLYYTPSEHQPADEPRPKPQKTFAPPRPYTDLTPPKEIKTIEELYLTGLRITQFYSPYINPMPYFEEALKRDPNDYRVNTQLAILDIKNFNWVEAEKKLRIAIERITMYYTRPKDCEAIYYLGYVLKMQGKTDDAYENLYRASWSSAWHSASHYLLAEIDCQRGDFNAALEHLNNSISMNTENVIALNLKAIVLRKLNKTDEAKKQLLEVINKNKLNHQALYELYLSSKSINNPEDANLFFERFSSAAKDEIQSYLELACEYINSGFYQEAVDLLSIIENKGENSPMLYYYLGYLYGQLGDAKKAAEYCKTASEKPNEYCFPFRAEEVDILNFAQSIDPTDSFAPYYLGNMLYERQPEKAISEWEKSRNINDSFYIVHRNLGLAYKEVRGDYGKALASMKIALNKNNEDGRLIYEIDMLNELNRLSAKECYEFFIQNLDIVNKRSETMISFARKAVEYGMYDKAIEILISDNLVEFENDLNMQSSYLDAYTLKGVKYIENGDYDEALENIKTALAYPIRYGREQYAQSNYFLGLINKKLGNKEVAAEYFKKALEVNIVKGDVYVEYYYYQGMALMELGKPDEAKKVFNDILDVSQLVMDEGPDRFVESKMNQLSNKQKATQHYLRGLANKGLGKKETAINEFDLALIYRPGHIWSLIHRDLLIESKVSGL